MSPKKAPIAASPAGGSTLAKVGLWAVLGVVGYGFATGQIDIGSIGGGATNTDTAAAPVVAKKATASTGIPAEYLALYQASAGTCRHLDWALLAGVGFIETKHGTYQGPGVSSGTNSAGAAGPMQFLAGTWTEVRAKHPDIGPDIYDPAHAIPAAAHKLCDDGVAAGNVEKALRRYNNSGKYVRDVTAKAADYRNLGGGAQHG